MEEIPGEMAKGEAARHVRLTFVIHKKGGAGKKKKEAKKEKRDGNMENRRSFPHSHHGKQTTNYLILIFKKRTCIVHPGLTELCIDIIGFTHK